MRRKSHKNEKRRSAGKVITGMLLGSVVGATVGWLTAPTAGREMRRRITGEVMSARDKAKSAIGNVESRARKLATELNETTDHFTETAPRRRKTSTPTSS
jgi:gas vesicle protein